MQDIDLAYNVIEKMQIEKEKTRKEALSKYSLIDNSELKTTKLIFGDLRKAMTFAAPS